jgi:chemotaxis protein MotB
VRDKLLADTTRVGRDLRRLEKNYSDLNKSYDFLLDNNNTLLASNARENRAMLERLKDLDEALQDKQDSLLEEREAFENVRKQLSDREKRIAELENLIGRQDSAISAVFDRISSALKGYEGKGLSVVERDGKVFVSMQNSLLFASGSWTVNEAGAAALRQLRGVLASESDLFVLVEGHTDNDPYSGKGSVADNWDLSVLRATSIVRILTAEGGVDPKRLTAAGKGEFDPIRPNDGPANKALNRRTEIIVAPDFAELSRLLDEMNSLAPARAQ